ncbi:MAG: hypothetical protein ABFD54_04045 [Armatimonadota bacterium]|nr:hypothetical protein [bacterium]
MRPRIFAAIIMTAGLLALPLFTPSSRAQTLSQSADALGVVTDVIVGHNNKGPYTLSWTNIDDDTVEVVLSGRTLRRGNDYTIDSANGLMSFNAILLNDAIVRVSYKITQGKSQPTSKSVSVPVSISLLQGQNSSLNVTGLYKQDDPNNPEAAKTVVGLGGNKSWSGGKLDTMFLMSQRMNDTSGADQGTAWDRSAVKLGNSTNIGQLKLTGSYLHAGNQFTGSKEYSTGVGKNAMDLGAVYGSANSFQASFKFQDNADTVNGNYAKVNEQSMTYKPGDSTRLSVAHSVNESGTAVADSGKTVESSSVKLDQSFGGNTKAVAAFDTAKVNQGDTQDQIQTRQLSISSAPVQGVNVQASAVQKQSDINGAEQKIAAGVTLAPNQQMALQAGYQSANSDSAGQVNSTNVSVKVSPNQQLAVQAGITTTDSEQSGQSTNTSVNVKVAPISQVALQASYVGTDAENAGQTANTNVSVSLAPVKNLELKGSLLDKTQNQDEQFQRDLSLSSAPTKYTKLTAQFSQKGLNDNDDVTRGAALELLPFTHTKLAAGYKYTETGAQVLTIWDYAASTKPCKFLSFNGNFRDRQLQQDIIPDTMKLNLALSPLGWVSFTGDYQENPEDSTGAIQTYKSTALGVNVNVGTVGVLTNYTSKDEYQLSRLSDERQIGLQLPAFGHGKLSTGFKLARLLNGSELAIRTYSLGYDHAVGSDFKLSLTGYYTQYLENQAIQPDKTEYKAEANLGVSF